jgi:hypothetical protein
MSNAEKRRRITNLQRQQRDRGVGGRGGNGHNGVWDTLEQQAAAIRLRETFEEVHRRTGKHPRATEEGRAAITDMLRTLQPDSYRHY